MTGRVHDLGQKHMEWRRPQPSWWPGPSPRSTGVLIVLASLCRVWLPPRLTVTVASLRFSVNPSWVCVLGTRWLVGALRQGQPELQAGQAEAWCPGGRGRVPPPHWPKLHPCSHPPHCNKTLLPCRSGISQVTGHQSSFSARQHFCDSRLPLCPTPSTPTDPHTQCDFPWFLLWLSPHPAGP